MEEDNEDQELFEEEVEEEEGSEESMKGASILSPWQWNWEMSMDERWEAIYNLVSGEREFLHVVTKFLNRAIVKTRDDYRDAKVKANSAVYNGMEVIGGTIVGCCTRLEAIRSTNPFAILVEEASEVLEPLLFSCLVPSTCKFELIGDHLQLQPSLMQRFEFETRNKMNISMFQRLICGPAHGVPGSYAGVPSSVLSIQRRMRKNICDLTRGFYHDITEITDHSFCNTKTIPVKVECEGDGREVPGVLPHLFFWKHNGKESKARKGVSKENIKEAELVVKLASYLVSCGVPKTSIAVLTPYKGQLMLLRDELQKAQIFTKPFSKGTNTRKVVYGESSCRISTVDRFQGDEADVVLISLVIDERSTTPFVKLQNRMIVLLSRARLGMYIVGNFGYFEKNSPQHWASTFEILQRPAVSDTKFPEEDPCTTYEQLQMGEELPLCCPQHRVSTKMVKNSSELKLGFCKVPCHEALKCGHECGLDCHWPSLKHNPNCKQLVDVPCARHPKKIFCHALPWIGSPNMDAALRNYKCTNMVQSHLPCGHTENYPCHKELSYVTGKQDWPDCKQPSDLPFVYDACKHAVSCSCVDYRRWTANPNAVAPCNRRVTYHPECGHEVEILCTLKQQYEKGLPFICNKKVDCLLPRCHHQVSVSCPIAAKLGAWTGNSCRDTGIVLEGSDYGPKDYVCQKTVKFVRQCGHEETRKCEEAFDLAKYPSKCTKKVTMQHPTCGHEITITCHEKAAYANPSTSRGAIKKCTKQMDFMRPCGHPVKVECHQSSTGPTDPCSEFVSIQNPLCGHHATVKCHMSTLGGWNPWSLQSKESPEYKKLMLEHIIPEGVSPSALPKGVTLSPCKGQITCIRKCGHETKLPCHQFFDSLFSKKPLGDCTEVVEKPLKCGHPKKIPCSHYTAHITQNSRITCSEKVMKRCWNFGVCHNTVPAVCSSNDVPCCTAKSVWKCHNGHEYNFELCSKGAPEECPGCEEVNLEHRVEALEKLGNPNTPDDLDESILKRSPPATNPGTRMKNIEITVENARQFVHAQTRAIHSYHQWYTSQDPLTRPLFHPMFVPCFSVMPEANMTKLHPKAVVNTTLAGFGVPVRPWTAKALQVELAQIQQQQPPPPQQGRGGRGGRGRGRGGRGGSNGNSQQQQQTIIIEYGYGWTCRPLQLQGNAKRKGGWVLEQQKQGYDCAISQDQCQWVFWEPYCIYPTHRITISVQDLTSLIATLQRAGSTVSFQPKYLTFELPKVAPQISQRPVVAPNACFNNTEAKGLGLSVEWDGLTFGLACQVAPAVERELQRKLSFCSLVFPNTKGKSKDPFAGIKVIEELLASSEPELFELFLPLGLEYLQDHLRYTSESKARECISKYVTWTKKQNMEAHPLLLLALARLNQDSEILKTQFLTTLVKAYPQSKVWLTEKEITISRGLPVNSPKVSSASLSPKEQWEALKQKEGCSSKSMEELLEMIGLRKVKHFAVSLFTRAVAFNKMPAEVRAKNQNMTLNFAFVGNPGTGRVFHSFHVLTILPGKTTVARHIANILCDSGMRKKKTFIETGAQQLKDEGTDNFRQQIKQAMDGVLFIDEAYDLDPKGDFKGKPIVSELLTASENLRDRISFILAGYQDDMNEKFFSYNDGLKSRIEEIVFEDYDEAELKILWQSIIEEKKWFADDSVANIVCKRLARQANKKGFGNARAVRRMAENAISAACTDEDFDGTNMILEVRHVIGDRPSENPKLPALLEEIEKKTGWATIKAAIKEIIEFSDNNFDRELKGLGPMDISYHKIFLGNPGTGKR